MANLVASTGFYPVGNGLIQLGFYTLYNDATSGLKYVHMKTNIALSTYVMIMIEAVGSQPYGGGPIRTTWNFYTYSYLVSSYFYHTYTGFIATGCYVAADNYIVIKGLATESSGLSFSLNSYNTAGSGRGAGVTITACSINDVSGSYY